MAKKKKVFPPKDIRPVRAFELPLQHTLPENWEIIREAWKQSACLANWCVQQCMKLDVTRTADMKSPKELGKFAPETDIYALATKDFNVVKGSWWSGQAGSFAAICKKVRDEWVDHRWDILWHGHRPIHYENPYPFPIRGQEWIEAGFEDGKPYVVVNLPSGIPRKTIKAKLHLRGGPEFGRQIALFKQVVEGKMPKYELQIRWQRVSQQSAGELKDPHNGHTCNRSTVKVNGAYGRVLVKMVARVNPPEKKGNRCLALIRDPHAFWIAELDSRKSWVLNADNYLNLIESDRRHQDRLAYIQKQLQTAAEEHQKHLANNQRFNQDMKAERRMKVHRIKRKYRKIEKASLKDHNRLASVTHEAAAMVVNFALRNYVGEIFYLDSDKGYMPQFPWHDLHQKLQHKCKLNGIDFYSETSLCRGDSATNYMENNNAEAGQETWQRIARLRETAVKKITTAKNRKGSHQNVSKP